MSTLLDTNVAIRLRDGDATLVDAAPAPDTLLFISVLTLVELQGGLATHGAITLRRRLLLDRLLQDLHVLDLTTEIVEPYRRIIEVGGFSRRKVIDRLIAATAIVHDMTLVTSNPADFRDIPGLRLEVWPPPAPQ